MGPEIWRKNCSKGSCKTKTTKITNHTILPPTTFYDDRTPSWNRKTMSDRVNGPLTNRYITRSQARFIVEFVSVQKQPHDALTAPQFRAIQKVYCTFAQIFDESELLLARWKPKHRIMPERAAKEKRHICAELSKGPLTQLGYTYVDDGWTSRAKNHMRSALIFSPRRCEQLLYIIQVNTEALYAVAVAR